MGLLGSTKAIMFAQGGVARGGATRGGYHSPRLFLTIDGVHLATGRETASALVREASLVIEKVNRQPHTATFVTRGVIPITGQPVVIQLGSKNRIRRLFAGHVLTVDEAFVGTPGNYSHKISAIDYTWGAGWRLVTGRFTGSASDIAAELMAFAPAGYSVGYIESGLATVIGGITFTEQKLPAALSQLAARVGAQFYFDYYGRLHFFMTDSSRTAPRQLTPTTPTLRKAEDGTGGPKTRRTIVSAVNRIFVEGGGGKAVSVVEPGETILPIDAPEWYQTDGGVVKSGPQHIAYAGVDAGGTGSIVGPGVTPLTAPDGMLEGVTSGGTIGTDGTRTWAVTFVTSAGETLPSPLLELTLGVAEAPTSAPALGTPTIGDGPDDGEHGYAVTFTDAGGGETEPGPLASIVTGPVADPATAPTLHIGNDSSGSVLTPGVTYDFAYTYSLRSASTDLDFITGLSPSVSWLAVPGKKPSVRCPCSPDPRVLRIHVWRRVNGSGATWKTVFSFANYPSEPYVQIFAFYPNGASLPSANAIVRQVSLTNIPLGGNGITGRKIYRTEAGGSQLKLVAAIADNTTTTFLDTVVDASLGANAPSSTSMTLWRVRLENIPLGGEGVTGRNVYRSTKTNSQLLLLTAIADNTTTEYLDTTQDVALSPLDTAPVSDTSGLSLEAGVLPPGSTSILVAGAGSFRATGGWAIIGNGQQVVRYTGISASALTGIPAIGTGALTAAVSYGSSITAAPQLTGIPSSGDGAIQYQILRGDDVNLFVQVDDEAAQAVLADYTGLDGIVMDTIQDRRLSYDECVARGTAQLSLLSPVDETLTYESYDINHHVGGKVDAELDEPTPIDRDFRIQKVVIHDFTNSIPPIHDIVASSQLYTLDELLMSARRSA